MPSAITSQACGQGDGLPRKTFPESAIPVEAAKWEITRNPKLGLTNTSALISPWHVPHSFHPRNLKELVQTLMTLAHNTPAIKKPILQMKKQARSHDS